VIAVPCAILLATDLTVAALLTVEWFKTYPVGGSGAGKRRAEKRAAEAADGASNFPSTQNRWNSPVESESSDASGECVGGFSISTGSVVQTTPAKQWLRTWIEKCRKALTRREQSASTAHQNSVTASGQCPPVDSSSVAARCLVPDSDQPAS